MSDMLDVLQHIMEKCPLQLLNNLSTLVTTDL